MYTRLMIYNWMRAMLVPRIVRPLTQHTMAAHTSSCLVTLLILVFPVFHEVS